jgi:hypothetical protein
MNRLPVLLFLVLALASGCRKSSENIVWEKTLGTGNALFVKATADSGIISCGELDGKPYMIKLDRNKKIISEYKYGNNGLYNSFWGNSDFSIIAGNTKGKMLITCLDRQNNLLWDTTLTSTIKLDYSSVCYLGNGEFVCVGTVSPDSITVLSTKIFCVWFDASGTITDKREFQENSSVSVNRALCDNNGGIYLAFTRQYTGSKPRATVVKYNYMFQKLWETELYNNPGFLSSTHGIMLDNSGSVFVTGKTALSDGSTTVDNSFSARLENSGIITWRKYLESANSGSSVIIDKTGQLFILNTNCLRINVLNASDGIETGVIRTFNACDSEKTTFYGTDFDFNYDGNLIIAGSKSGGFYLVMKSPLNQDPV